MSKDCFSVFPRLSACSPYGQIQSGPSGLIQYFTAPEGPTSLLHLIRWWRARSAPLRRFCVDFGCYLERAPSTLPAPFLHSGAALLDFRAVLRALLDSPPPSPLHLVVPRALFRRFLVVPRRLPSIPTRSSFHAVRHFHRQLRPRAAL